MVKMTPLFVKSYIIYVRNINLHLFTVIFIIKILCSLIIKLYIRIQNPLFKTIVLLYLLIYYYILILIFLVYNICFWHGLLKASLSRFCKILLDLNFLAELYHNLSTSNYIKT